MGIDGSITLKGFFRCPCGKLHTYSCIDRSTRCPECGRGLTLVAIQPEPVSPRVVQERLASLGAPRTGAVVAGFLRAHRESETAPRAACGICSFEYPRGEPQRHTCTPV